jgi:hypothetical protein
MTTPPWRTPTGPTGRQEPFQPDGSQVSIRLGPAICQATGTGKQFMKNQNFTTAFSVAQSPQETFDAINNVRGWWSEEIDGHTNKLVAEFKFHHKEVHRSTQKITELVRGKKVVWHVSDSQLNFVKTRTSGQA